MKRMVCCLMAAILCALAGCGSAGTEQKASGDKLLLATTKPVYELAQAVVGDTAGFRVELLIQEQVSCLHDYSITTGQMKKIEQAEAVILSGAGLEDFMASSLSGKDQDAIIDSADGIELLGDDPHIWLDPRRYAQQGLNIAAALGERYPEYADTFQANAKGYTDDILEAYQSSWYPAAQSLSCKELITFHDGFSYFADAYGLTILAAMEEEEGAEPSAAELKKVMELTREHQIPMIFAEKNGAANAAEIVSEETGAKLGILNLGMSSDSGDYKQVMNENISALKAGLQ